MKTDTKKLAATLRKVADGHTVRDCLGRVAADRLEELERELADRAESWRLSSVCRAKEARIERLELDLAAKDSHAEEIYKASVDLANMLSDKLDAETALADRLAEACQWAMPELGRHTRPSQLDKALAAWKEARKP